MLQPHRFPRFFGRVPIRSMVFRLGYEYPHPKPAPKRSPNTPSKPTREPTQRPTHNPTQGHQPTTSNYNVGDGNQNNNTGGGSQNVNYGGDQFNYHYTGVERRSRYFITGTDEEEAEYEQYTEIRRCDFVADNYVKHTGPGQHTFSSRFEGKFAFTGKLRLGGRNEPITVVSYEGPTAGDKWKEDFQAASGIPNERMASLIGINRSKIPLLIFTGSLLPLQHFIDQVGELGKQYLASMRIQLCCTDNAEVWMDPRQGILCRGPRGPPVSSMCLDILTLEKLPADIELLKETVLFRSITNLKIDGLRVDRKVVESLSMAQYRLGYRRPKADPRRTVWLASNRWSQSGRDCLLVEQDRSRTEKSWIRFELKEQGRRRAIGLETSSNDQGCFSSAISALHACNIPIDNSVNQYVFSAPSRASGILSRSTKKRRRRQSSPPIYLFVTSCPFSTFWSFDVDGETANPISQHLCRRLGLPIKFMLSGAVTYSWSMKEYKLLREYLIGRRFAPTTADFALSCRYDFMEPVKPVRWYDHGRELAATFRIAEDCGMQPDEDLSMSSLFGLHDGSAENSEADSYPGPIETSGAESSPKPLYATALERLTARWWLASDSLDIHAAVM
ncbi:hypothetical protein PQX77_016469 [Marasmius sp. AFHP31]|nr:hypothetical protein PQX77_016469 [Marasmius sp. AFHP31]